MSRLLESIKVLDNQIHNLDYHKDRIIKSLRTAYGNHANSPIDFDLIKKDIEKPDGGLYKLRLTYDESRYNYELIPYQIKPINSLKIIEGRDITYDLKWADRDCINQLYNQKATADDILIVKDGLITDTSYCNVALFRDGIWYTPQTPLLHGTKRAQLLEQKIIQEAKMTVDQISTYTQCRLFNALIDFGQIEISTDNMRY